MTTQTDDRVLAVHPGALGDIVLFGRLLERIGGSITLAARGERGRLLEGLGVVGRALDFDALPMHELFTDDPLTEARLPALLGEHDRLVSCFATGDTRAELRLSAAAAVGQSAFLPIRCDEGFQCHLLDLWFDLLMVPAMTAGEVTSAWHVPPAWVDEGQGLLRKAGVDPAAPYVVLHPGAGSPDKCWGLDRYLQIADELRGRVGVVVTVGPVEMERWGGVLTELQRVSVLADPPLSALAGVLTGAGAYLGNDSGPSHLAAAVGAPTLALFGPTRAEHFAPLGPRVRTRSGRTMGDIALAPVLDALGEWVPTKASS